jgi:Swt1-like HEPN
VATNRQLRADLLKQLGNVTPQRLSQLVGEIKRDHGPMNTEDATYVLAHMRGLDLTKYLDKEVVDRLRGMIPRGQPARTPTKAAPADPVNGRGAPARLIKAGSTAPAVDLLLSPTVAGEAAAMADLYPKMYLLENSIRSLINRVMTASHGAGWWATHAPTDVQKTVKGRKDKEDKVPWHGKRGAHEIYYSDFSDLRNIITKNWTDFQPIIPKQQWIAQWLEELEPARNTLAHNNPVAANEKKRLEVFFDDWVAFIKANGASIP